MSAIGALQQQQDLPTSSVSSSRLQDSTMSSIQKAHESSSRRSEDIDAELLAQEDSGSDGGYLIEPMEPHSERRRTSIHVPTPASGESSISGTAEYAQFVVLSSSLSIDNHTRRTKPSIRLVLLIANLIPIISNTRRKRHSNTREKQPREVILFIPEHIIRQIPRYDAELDEEMEDVEDEGQTFEIADPIARHQVALVRAIEYVGGALIPPIDASAGDVQRTLAELLAVYDVSIGLEIKTLEEKILNHIESCPGMSTEAFLTFARTVYAGDENSDLAGHATDSSIGKLIKRKLAVLLPQLLQDGTVRSIKAEGGTLSNELLEVMIDYYSGKQGIKIED